jgi:hypothetical protein
VFAIAIDLHDHGCSLELGASTRATFHEVASGTNAFDAQDGYAIWLRDR